MPQKAVSWQKNMTRLLLTKKCLNFSFCLGNCFKVKTNVLT